MVGTALYVSPEVQGSTKSAYNQVKKEALGGKGKIKREREREREREKKEYKDHSTGGSVTSWDSRKHSFTQSVQFSHSVVSDYLQPHGLQHARLPCLSPAPGACSDSCPSSQLPSEQLILGCPLLLLPSVFPSIRVFSIESALPIRWLKYWNFSISPSNEHPGLVSFRMDWLDLLAVQVCIMYLLSDCSR